MDKLTTRIRRRINDVCRGNSRTRRISQCFAADVDIYGQLNDSDVTDVPKTDFFEVREDEPTPTGEDDRVHVEEDGQELPDVDSDRTEIRHSVVETLSTVGEACGRPTDEIEENDAQQDVTSTPEILTVTWEEAQAMREATYMTFEGEDENDYTKGPVRTVFASDGVEWVTALLMTLPLSQKIQKALRFMRSYAQRREKARRRKEQLSHLSRKIKCQMSNHQYKLNQLGNGVSAKDPRRLDLQTQMSMLELMLKETTMEIQCIDADLNMAGGIAREINESALSELQDAFVQALLLEPEEAIEQPAFEFLDLKTEYQRFCEERQEAGSYEGGPLAELDTGREHLMAPRRPMTQEEEEAERLTSIFWWSLQRLGKAEAAFDRGREDWQAEIEADYNFAVAAEQPLDGLTDESGHGWYQRLQDLTRELRDAEEMFADAKAAAAWAALDIPLDDRTSDFVDDADDGYPASLEQRIAASAPVPFINAWMSDMPDRGEPASPSQDGDHAKDVDEWNFRDVEICDSISTFAGGHERKQIERWRRRLGPAMLQDV